MSHEIQKNDAAAFNAQAAWHGLGTVLPEGELDIETVRVHAPGFLFPIESRPLVVGKPAMVMTENGFEEGVIPDRTADGGYTTVPDQVAQIAGDTGEVLSVTGDRYEKFENAELLGLAAEISAFGEGTKLESVLTLRGRRTAVVLAHAGQFVLPGDDVNENYYLFSTTHDGTGALAVAPTSIRVVCKNTLNIALREGSGIRIRHTRNMQDAITRGVAMMAHSAERLGQFEEAAQRMAARPISKAEADKFFLDVYTRLHGPIVTNPKTRGEKSQYTRAVDTIASYMANLDDPRQRMQGNTNVWSLLNAVTQHADHDSTVRRSKGSTTQQSRQASNLFGTNHKVKHTALDLALQLV